MTSVVLFAFIAALQQRPVQSDSIPPRRDYKDLTELLANLPNVAAPVFDDARALWLGSLPLGCVDRLQNRPGRGGGGNRAGGPPAATTDSTPGRGGAVDSAGRGRGAADSAGRRGGGAGGRATLSGADYFW